jgi:hypothetical protein
MSDPILSELIRFVESSEGEAPCEVPIAIQVSGARHAGVLISSREFLRLFRLSPASGEMKKAHPANPDPDAANEQRRSARSKRRVESTKVAADAVEVNARLSAPRSGQTFPQGSDYLHLLSADGEQPGPACWRFRLDAIEGFTLGAPEGGATAR